MSVPFAEWNWVIIPASEENRQKILDIDLDLEYWIMNDGVDRWIVHLEEAPFQYMVFNQTDMGVMIDAVERICVLTKLPKDIKDLQNVVLSTIFAARDYV